MGTGIQQKSFIFSNTGLLFLIIGCHFLAFSMTRFDFKTPLPKQPIAMTFLGSIIDPLEMSKIKSQNYPTLDDSKTFPINKGQASRRNITELSKPDLNVFLKTQRKTNFKLHPPEISTNRTEILLNKPTETKNVLSTSQPYEHLRLK